MTYIVLLAVAVVALLMLSIVMLLYMNNLKKSLRKNNEELKNKELALGYAEYGLDMYKDEVKSLKFKIKKLDSENKLLVEKINKINSQFKNVKDYLK